MPKPKYLLSKKELDVLYSAMLDHEDMNNDDYKYQCLIWRIFDKIKVAQKSNDKYQELKDALVGDSDNWTHEELKEHALKCVDALNSIANFEEWP